VAIGRWPPPRNSKPGSGKGLRNPDPPGGHLLGGEGGGREIQQPSSRSVSWHVTMELSATISMKRRAAACRGGREKWVPYAPRYHGVPGNRGHQCAASRFVIGRTSEPERQRGATPRSTLEIGDKKGRRSNSIMKSVNSITKSRSHEKTKKVRRQTGRIHSFSFSCFCRFVFS